MTETLLTVPPSLCRYLESSGTSLPSWLRRMGDAEESPPFIGTDPEGARLGSGGGTVHLLHQAWLASGKRTGLEAWLGARQRLILHSGGESRRLPAYAGVGKAFMPLPHIEGLQPRLPDQKLADFQLPAYRQTLQEAGNKAAALVTSGDVWLDFDTTDIPAVKADIVGIGMRVTAEVARHFGVYFVKRDVRSQTLSERPIAFFRQKPSAQEISKEALTYDFYVDTGMWLLSTDALIALFRRCGWDSKRQAFATKSHLPAHLDLYTEVGAALGETRTLASPLKRAGFARLTTAVIPLGDARFYHLGSTRQLLESMEQLQWKTLTPQRAFRIASTAAPGVQRQRDLTWIEGCQTRSELRVEGLNVVTGLPAGSAVTRLSVEQCLDVLPVQRGLFAVRPYHIDDTLRGEIAHASVCGLPARDWFDARGLETPTGDIFRAKVYPALKPDQITDELVEWFFSSNPDEAVSARMRDAARYSAAELADAVDFADYFAHRAHGYKAVIRASFDAALNGESTAIFEQDFSALARFCRNDAPALGKWLRRHATQIMAAAERPEHQARFAMFLSELETGKRKAAWAQQGFQKLQSAVITSNQVAKVTPVRVLKEDQIVWGRSPVRLDLAGGWTDTPPYCLEAGGAVLNVAVLLNGQPPIQAFVRPTSEPVLTLRSIDLGSAETVESYRQLAEFRNPKGNFSLPKAALALAGFLPEFCAGSPSKSLQQQLQKFGSGLEISLLSAVPKGSGLGTSSILGATLLGALNRACGLGWDEVDLYNRVLAVEQLLTTGGGWQDQAGALFPGVKLVQTLPGLSQVPTVRYLSPQALDGGMPNRSLLLYYTGATRLAKGILQEIVRDMFLGSARTHRLLQAIRSNAWKTYHALQLRDVPAIQRSIGRSWRLNQDLDSGTCTAEIERIIETCGDDLASCKLLGAGGGGYMLISAKSAQAGDRIREKLEGTPPNRRARFIDFAVSDTGLQVTVS